MSEELLLDTHIALWLDTGDDRLRPSTIHSIDACRQGGGTIRLSAVSVWEMALLIEKDGSNSTCRSGPGLRDFSGARG